MRLSESDRNLWRRQPLRSGRIAILLLGLILPGAGAAPAQSPPPPAETTNLPECYCRAGGRIYGMGQQVCLAISGQAGLYRCEMEQNVTSWKAMGQPCPQS